MWHSKLRLGRGKAERYCTTAAQDVAFTITDVYRGGAWRSMAEYRGVWRWIIMYYGGVSDDRVNMAEYYYAVSYYLLRILAFKHM